MSTDRDPQDLVQSLDRLSTGSGLTSYAPKKLPADVPVMPIPQRTGSAVSE